MRVKILKDGNRLAVRPTSARLAAVLEPILRYRRKVLEMDRGVQRVYDEPVDCFAYKQDRLVCPAGYASRVKAALKEAGILFDVVSLRKHPNPMAYEARWGVLNKHELRWRQEEVLRTIAKFERSRIGCPTGYGKTFLARLLASVFFRSKIHIVFTSMTLALDCYKALVGVLPSVGIVCSKKKVFDQRVMIYTAGSLHYSDYKADIVMVDEVHEAATDIVIDHLVRYRYAKMVGLSASHNKRLDKADFELEGIFGPVRIDIPYREAQAHDMVVPIKIMWHPVIMADNPCDGYEGVSKKRAGLWCNLFRNRIVADVANQYGEDEQVLIMVDKIEHAVHLKALLPNFKLCYSVNGMHHSDRNGYIHNGYLSPNEPIMTHKRSEWLREKFSKQKIKKVIATGVWSRGVDFRNLQVLIRVEGGGRPISDDQLPGRVSRICPETGKQVGVVHDFMDQFDPGFYAKALSRKRSYKKHGWEQIIPNLGGGRYRKQIVTGF